jgi:hypothetical protein
MSRVTARPRTAEYGLGGDLQTAASVATNGTTDWFCVPHFDGLISGAAAQFDTALNLASGGGHD